MNTDSRPHEWVGLKLTPLDVLFFRDGRPFADNLRNSGGFPSPQTLVGALRTAMLEEAGKLDEFVRLWKSSETRQNALDLAPDITGARFRGPWLMKGPQVLLPIPGDLAKIEKQSNEEERIVRLSPTGSANSQFAKVPQPLSTDNPDAKPASGFISHAVLANYLAGTNPTPDNIVSPKDLFGFETRTGIVIHPDSLTAQDADIYSVRLLALAKNVCFYAEVSASAPVPKGPIRFGGEGRHVTVEKTPPIKWPGATSPHAKQLWYLATPGLFGGLATSDLFESWKLPLTKGEILSAAVGNPVAVSGWDNTRNGPRPTRWAAPAGSVYYTDQPADRREPASFGHTQEEGFGLSLPGFWKGQP